MKESKCWRCMLFLLLIISHMCPGIIETRSNGYGMGQGVSKCPQYLLEWLHHDFFCNNEHPVEGQLQGTLVCPMIQHIRIDWDPVWFLQHLVEDQSQSSKMIKVTILLLICAPLLASAASSGKSHKIMLFFHPGSTPNLMMQVRNVERRHSVQILTSSVMKASGLSFDFLSLFLLFLSLFSISNSTFHFFAVASNGKGRKVQEPITALGPALERGKKHQRWGNSYRNGG